MSMRSSSRNRKRSRTSESSASTVAQSSSSLVDNGNEGDDSGDMEAIAEFYNQARQATADIVGRRRRREQDIHGPSTL